MATFKARARAVDMLGRQQIAGVPNAISELFKNAHDAYADRVEVNYFLSDDIFILHNDGLGMTKQDFEERWLTLGTESKLQQSHSHLWPKGHPARRASFFSPIPQGEAKRSSRGRTNRARVGNRSAAPRQADIEPVEMRYLLTPKPYLILIPYEWLGELRTEHSLRLSNHFAALLSRVGLDESEWLRLWAPKQ